MWTFGRKIAAGFTLAVVLLLIVGTVAYRSLHTLTKTSEWVTHTHLVLERIAATSSQLNDAEIGQRGYLLTSDETLLAAYHQSAADVLKTAREVRTLTADNPQQQRRLDMADPLLQSALDDLAHGLDVYRAEGPDAARKFVAAVVNKKTTVELRRVLLEMEQDERSLLKTRTDEADSAGTSAMATIIVGTLVCFVAVTFAGISITRSVGTQIGAAVRNVHSSSAELQAAASQQATGSREQSTALAEVTTTINELLATARQIAESAQRVAQMTTQAASAARSGDDTVRRTQESLASIRRQVDAIVSHMLELGKKSQQIGAILEIINELAEQTNILAINATIEAAGAGDSGKRFGVVADEIRKLADRVGGSTKDIRKLVDDIRAAVNTTVMATEGGSKAVDAGSRQFDNVAASFNQIVGLVTTTTEAAREIELSTKQQASAVEQVTLAVANVSQAAKETETSSTQTLQTSGQLTTLARELSRLVQPETRA